MTLCEDASAMAKKMKGEKKRQIYNSKISKHDNSTAKTPFHMFVTDSKVIKNLPVWYAVLWNKHQDDREIKQYLMLPAL